jgi:hypothetical protein
VHVHERAIEAWIDAPLRPGFIGDELVVAQI